MNSRLSAAAAILIGALLSVNARADEPAIRKVLASKLPEIKVLSVKKLPYAGLYEVAVKQAGSTRIFYTDAAAKVILVGANLIETGTDRSLTEERLRSLTRIDWNALPLQWAITTRRGNGRREIAVFSDPNCPYCRKFERELAQVDDITVHVFLYPVIKPESVQQTKSVWCSSDRAKAWRELMLNDVQPTARTDCPNPINELVALGKKLGATSTPTWFVRTGDKYQGALPIEKIVALLDAAARR